ncbi:hypothetical protein Fcan01_23133 [Folsomia candida]|uniref:Uncharacterized protein n=1 Tax=Folsomia candida TaxID=158441 RepID=A0A226DC16_FOLCA|nr:hypothetical protein Fcan01_23133 [Folsomia candida]
MIFSALILIYSFCHTCSKAHRTPFLLPDCTTQNFVLRTNKDFFDAASNQSNLRAPGTIFYTCFNRDKIVLETNSKNSYDVHQDGTHLRYKLCWVLIFYFDSLPTIHSASNFGSTLQNIAISMEWYYYRKDDLQYSEKEMLLKFGSKNSKPFDTVEIIDCIVYTITRTINASLYNVTPKLHRIMFKDGGDCDMKSNFTYCPTPHIRFQRRHHLGTQLTDPTIILTGFARYNFLTCFSEEKENGGESKFNPYFYYVGTIFVQYSTIPETLSKSNSFRINNGVWAICSTILVNCYIGLAITSLNSPLGKMIPNDFATIFCAKRIPRDEEKSPGRTLLRSRNHLLHIHHLKQLGTLKPPKYQPYCFSLLSAPTQRDIPVAYFAHFYALNNIFRSFAITGNYNARWVNEILYNMMDTKIRFYPIEFKKYVDNQSHQLPDTDIYSAIEEEIVTCGKSILYADRTELMTQLKYYKKNYHWIKFNQLTKQTSIPGDVFGREFETTRDSPVVKSFVALLESEIYKILNEFWAKNEFQKQ